MKYYFTIVFDKNENIISPNQLPNIKKNENFNKILEVCDVKIIAEKDKIFPGEIQGISLEYLNKKNTFVWRIRMPDVKGKKPMEEVRRFLLIDSYTGKIIKRETEIWYEGCLGNPIPDIFDQN